jgi:hypothetical protein
VADAGAVDPLKGEPQVVDDDLGDDAAAPEVLRLGRREAAGDQRKARPLRRVEADELRRPVEQPQADHVAVEAHLGLDVLDEDQRAADLADVAEGLDRRHGQPSSRRATG